MLPPDTGPVIQHRHARKNQGAAQHSADGTLHGFLGADFRYQLVLSEQSAGKVCKSVGHPRADKYHDGKEKRKHVVQADNPCKAPYRVQEHGKHRADRCDVCTLMIQHRHTEQVHDKKQDRAQRDRADSPLLCAAVDQRIADTQRCGKCKQAKRHGNPGIPVQSHTAEQFKNSDQGTEREQDRERPRFGEYQDRDKQTQSHGGCQNPFQHMNNLTTDSNSITNRPSGAYGSRIPGHIRPHRQVRNPARVSR